MLGARPKPKFRKLGCKDCIGGAALDQLGRRLPDANRTIGQPNKITTIFGRKVTKYYKGKLQTVIEDLHLPNPVIRTHYAKASSSSMSGITCACAPTNQYWAAPSHRNGILAVPNRTTGGSRHVLLFELLVL
jgi:hypothetical protein